VVAVSFFVGENMDDENVVSMYEDINLFYNSNMVNYDNIQPAYRSIYCISKKDNELIVPSYSQESEITAIQHECVFRSFQILGYIENKKKLLKMNKDISKLYINVKNEYSEENMVSDTMETIDYAEKNTVEFNVDRSFKSLRWDPIDMKGCILKIDSVYIYGKDGAVEYPVDCIHHNGRENENGWIEFWTSDPNVYFDISGECCKIKIEFFMKKFNLEEAEKKFYEVERKNAEIKNSYAYKIGSIIISPAKKLKGLFK